MNNNKSVKQYKVLTKEEMTQINGGLRFLKGVAERFVILRRV